MNFVCDECSDSRTFAERCNAESENTLQRYPEYLRGKKDPEMLPILLSGERSLLTFDAQMAFQHAASIPSNNSGIIVIRLRYPGRTMTNKIMQSIIASFKKAYPYWRQVDYRNLHLEIFEDGVSISFLPLNGERISLKYADNFASAFAAAVAAAKPAPSILR